MHLLSVALLLLQLTVPDTESNPIEPTPEALTEAAIGLDESYDQLAQLVDDCPDGTCEEAAALVYQYESLEQDRGQLHDDRAALGGSHPEIDELIAAIDGLAAAVGGNVGGWNDDE